MRKIPLKLKREILADPFYTMCARSKAGQCDGRITWEHAIIFAGKQLNAKWSIIPLCEYHHGVNRHQDGGDLDKQINVWIALNRASDTELAQVSKAIDYVRLKRVLNDKYGIYNQPTLSTLSKINY